MTYEFRYFFDPGSGVCLWSNNEAANARYGYPVDHWELPLSENTKRWLQYLIAWFDTSLDWESPGDSDDTWSEDELNRFRAAARKGLEMLWRELPASHFSIADEIGA